VIRRLWPLTLGAFALGLDAYVLAGLSVGTALGVLVGLLIESRFGWRWTIGLIVMIGIVAAGGVAASGRLPAAPVIALRAGPSAPRPDRSC